MLSDNTNNISNTNNTGRRLPELLAPAGSLDKLKIAIHYGADAVYMGGAAYSLRAHAVLKMEEIAAAVSYAHERGVRVFITINIMAHNSDLSGLRDYLRRLRDMRVDGLIISDPGIFALARKWVPEINIHISTQANITNSASALFWQEQGAGRVNLARELTLAEIKEIRADTNIKLEVFVHGALCISYSGRCSLSLYMTGRDANHGNCAHPCRYRYILEEEKRPGQYFPVEEDGHGTYIFNSRDLCLLHRLPELMAAGVDSIKIEGRMKSVYYVGAVVRLYRAALDYIAARRETTEAAAITLPAAMNDELAKIGSRGYTENFFDGPPEQQDMLYSGIKYAQTHAPVGLVRQVDGRKLIEVRNQIISGDWIEYLEPGFKQQQARIIRINNEKGELEKANPGNMVELQTEPPIVDWQVNGLLRRKQPENRMDQGAG
ncbi:MAG TPA: U32 family peptidase [Desulfobacterales bacterium]|nr:U32 family peptidase [Desulfobacterales bacterium]